MTTDKKAREPLGAIELLALPHAGPELQSAAIIELKLTEKLAELGVLPIVRGILHNLRSTTGEDIL